jgi:hypothetical protein
MVRPPQRRRKRFRAALRARYVWPYLLSCYVVHMRSRGPLRNTLASQPLAAYVVVLPSESRVVSLAPFAQVYVVLAFVAACSVDCVVPFSEELSVSALGLAYVKVSFPRSPAAVPVPVPESVSEYWLPPALPVSGCMLEKSRVNRPSAAMVKTSRPPPVS